jgi:hypothetical protein
MRRSVRNDGVSGEHDLQEVAMRVLVILGLAGQVLLAIP